MFQLMDFYSCSGQFIPGCRCSGQFITGHMSVIPECRCSGQFVTRHMSVYTWILIQVSLYLDTGVKCRSVYT